MISILQSKHSRKILSAALKIVFRDREYKTYIDLFPLYAFCKEGKTVSLSNKKASVIKAACHDRIFVGTHIPDPIFGLYHELYIWVFLYQWVTRYETQTPLTAGESMYDP